MHPDPFPVPLNPPLESCPFGEEPVLGETAGCFMDSGVLEGEEGREAYETLSPAFGYACSRLLRIRGGCQCPGSTEHSCGSVGGEEVQPPDPHTVPMSADLSATAAVYTPHLLCPTWPCPVLSSSPAIIRSK